MQEVRAEGLDQLLDRLQDSLEVFRDARSKALDAAGRELLAAVRARIGGSGRVAAWQDSFRGSGGGYVAVRPKAKTYVTSSSGRRYAVGQVTNAIESGHDQEPGRYVPAIGVRLRRDRVPGKYMYQMTRPDAERLAQQACDQITQEVVQKLGGS